MPTRSQVIQAARFGYGINPGSPPFGGTLLEQLTADDPLANRWPTPDTVERFSALWDQREQQRSMEGGREMFMEIRRKMARKAAQGTMRTLARMVASPLSFRERLFAFWADHFTVSPKRANEAYMLEAYHNDAIRPHLSGPFSTMLKAAVTHPSMLFYLDQNVSVGPNSMQGERRNRGLNENLAREILELHTLGVDGGYTQEDVRQFAELLTGLTIGREGTTFKPRAAEPGAEEILGHSYGGNSASLADIHAFLDDLALMPATAHHLARKLVVHFIGPGAPEALAARMAENYLAQNGELMALYEVLLDDPAAMSEHFPKVRQPFEYVATVLRALDFDPEAIVNADSRTTRDLGRALNAMGQPPFRPNGPDGWPEEAESWITPPQLAARISWASRVAREYAKDKDPRALMQALLGDMAPQELAIAVSGAESKWEGVALLLVSPTLMRR